ncbi:dual specificity protein phosphatase PHS1 isoform X2 [Tanacetum coccineum]
MEQEARWSSDPSATYLNIFSDASLAAITTFWLGTHFTTQFGSDQIEESRVIHKCSPEWLKIKEAAEKAREITVCEADKVGEVTCSKLLEALELS